MASGAERVEVIGELMIATAEDPVIEEIVRRLVAAIDPDKIVLFGSRAGGRARPGSDIDLLIVKHTDQPRARALQSAYRALRGIFMPTDLLWYTPAEIADWSQVTSFIATRVLREGRVLYEKQP
ncbi:MAG: nucleotidyltransferase domain-containing protein [Pseudomonadota bacterium]